MAAVTAAGNLAAARDGVAEARTAAGTTVHKLSSGGDAAAAEALAGSQNAVSLLIAQLGGLIFSVFATTVALLACICAPIGASVAVCVYRIAWGQSRRAAARRKALQGFQQSLARLRRRRPGPAATGVSAAKASAPASSMSMRVAASVPVLSQRRRVLGLDVGRQLRFGFERLPGEPDGETDGDAHADGDATVPTSQR